MRKIIGIIGAGENICTKEMKDFATELGDRIVSEGFRIVSGGKGGVMEAVSNGGMNSENYFEGSIIGILPENNKEQANKFCDIVIPTGFGINRNTVIINTADILVAIGGGSGTLSEISFAWQYGKHVLCVTKFEGWAKEIAGKNLDSRHNKLLIPVYDIDEIIEKIHAFI